MMREGTRNFLVGATSIVALLGIAALLMLFGELDRWITSGYELTLRINNAAGLREGSEVRLDGVRIGSVQRIEARPGDPLPVAAHLLVDLDVRVPVSAIPSISTSMIGGGAVLDLKTPANFNPDDGFFSRDGYEEIVGKYETLAEQIASTLDQRMQPIIDALDKFQQLSDTYIKLGGNLNDLVRPQTEAQVAEGEQPNLRTAVARLNQVLADAQEALTMAKQWLGDEQILADGKAAVEKARILIERATAAVDRYVALADGLEADADALTNSLRPVADELGETLRQVRVMIDRATNGQGTVAQLLNNPDLYRSLDDAAVRLEQTLTEAKLLIEKFRKEGLPVQF